MTTPRPRWTTRLRRPAARPRPCLTAAHRNVLPAGFVCHVGILRAEDDGAAAPVDDTGDADMASPASAPGSPRAPAIPPGSPRAPALSPGSPRAVPAAAPSSVLPADAQAPPDDVDGVDAGPRPSADTGADPPADIDDSAAEAASARSALAGTTFTSAHHVVLDGRTMLVFPFTVRRAPAAPVRS
jgi:hypothetical protein